MLFKFILQLQQMEQLITIVEERRQSIHQIKQHSKQIHKSIIIEQQRKRNQRQNWILRILKTLKIYSMQQKKVILDTILKLMNNYQKIQNKPDDFQNGNFLESIINLFVQFYNMFSDIDLAPIRTIIRPNNSYIIVDLIKSLVQLGRKQFKAIIQQYYKQSLHSQSEKKFVIKPIIKSSPVTIKSLDDEDIYKQQKKQKNQLKLKYDQGKIDCVLFEKYGKVIDNLNIETCYQKTNQIYFNLLYANQKNNSKIQKYLDLCFGAKKHINYDASGLYTQQQIKKMVKQQKIKAQQRMIYMKELNGDCTAQQLKQLFKMKIQIFDYNNSMPVFQKPRRMRNWFPLIMVKNGDKLHPFKPVVEVNGNYYDIKQFEERFNKKIKTYLREQLNSIKKINFVKIMSDPEYLRFNKRQFIDYNQTKLNELLQKDLATAKKQSKQYKEVKQGFFPSIYSKSSSQQDGLLRNKVKSDSRLPTHLLMPSIKDTNTQKSFQKRLNYSTIVSNADKPSRSKIDHLIDTIVKSKDFSIK